MPPSTGKASGNTTHTKKLRVRHAYQDKGVFKTGVEVVEHEIEVDEDDEGKIMALRLYRDGKLTTSQIRDILLKQLKQERIFGYGSYEEFFNDYFRKQLVAVEDLNRI
jgi:hypothetical protein